MHLQAYLSLYRLDDDKDIPAGDGLEDLDPDEGGKDRKSFEFSIDGSGMKIEASQLGNLMCFINDHRGIEHEHNAAYVEVAINGFPVILVIACTDIEAR